MAATAEQIKVTVWAQHTSKAGLVAWLSDDDNADDYKVFEGTRAELAEWADDLASGDSFDGKCAAVIRSQI